MEALEIQQLVSEMTLDEKIGQIAQLPADCYTNNAGDRTGPVQRLGIDETDLWRAGSVLGWPGSAEECIRIQKTVVEKSRLHIPTIFMSDVVHGWKSIFPIPLALGSSWDPHLFEVMGKVSAQEATQEGVHVTFSPMVDLVRDPRWGRVMESTGEDVLLNSQFAASLIKGYQGDDKSESLAHNFHTLAACVKHFAGYGAPEAGRDYATVSLSGQELYEKYLPGYQAGIAAGAPLVMMSFNTIDGLPAHANPYLIQEVLRKKMGFTGVTISDFAGIAELIEHGIAADAAQAARKAFSAGCDVEMASVTYLTTLREQFETGKLSVQALDEAVLRILTLKNNLGLFDNPLRGLQPGQTHSIQQPAFREETYQAALESLVLLRNESSTSRQALLPLTPGKSVGLAGPFAHSSDLLGGWSAEGKQQCVEPLDAQLKRVVTDNLKVSQVACEPLAVSSQAIEEAVEIAKNVDTMILALGLPSQWSGEATSVTDLRLPASQRKLYQAVQQVNPNIVVVLVTGRPLDLTYLDSAPSILLAWFPGTQGARAIADTLVGKNNPSGKLTMTFPRNVGQVPIHYDALPSGRPETEENKQERYVSHYVDCANEPAYPFGFGKSYSSFSYSDLQVSSAEFSQDQPVTVSATVTNESSRGGTEIVQFYVHDCVGELSRPVRELKGFKRIEINPGESVRVSFTLTEEDVRYTHSMPAFARYSEPGDFLVTIGASSADTLPPLRVTLV